MKISVNVIKTFAYLLGICIFLLAMRESGVKWIERLVSWFPFQLFSAIIGVANIFVTTSFARQQIDKEQINKIIEDRKREDIINDRLSSQSKF